MGTHTCSNPDCNKIYQAQSNTDDGFCSFECWEKVNCLTPQVVQFEDIHIPNEI